MGMKKGYLSGLLTMAYAMSAMSSEFEDNEFVGRSKVSKGNSMALEPIIKDPNPQLGISVEYLEQYALILNGKSKIGIRKQARIKEKVENYAERLIDYFELISPTTQNK